MEFAEQSALAGAQVTTPRLLKQSLRTVIDDLVADSWSDAECSLQGPCCSDDISDTTELAELADIAKLAQLTQQLQQLQQLKAQRDQQRAHKLTKQALQRHHQQQQAVLHAQQLLQQHETRLAEIAQQKRHKQARAGLDSAKAQHEQVERQEKRVQALKRHNAAKAATVKANNQRNNYIRVLEQPKMIDAPDWAGNSNWQDYQQMQHQTYTLTSGKLSKPKIAQMRMRLSQDPFAMGGFRYVYFAQSESGKRYVAKRLYGESDDLASNVHDVEADIKDHLIAERCIADFHKRAKSKHVDPAPMRFANEASLIVVDSAVSAPACGKVVYFLEPLIEGQYCKWVQNNGEINTTPSIEGQDIVDTAQAMMHFSYEMSLKKGRHRRYMITDIQGFKIADESITLIDPAICRPHVPGVTPNGADYGVGAAAKTFFKAHKCSQICHALKLAKHEA